MKLKAISSILFGAILGSSTPTFAIPTEDGIYATFEITHGETPLGSFTCELHFEQAPLTVANFAGLAEGLCNWIDFQTGEVKEKIPFYDGITFHRVIEGFVIQAGSPNGTGSDGPGYRFIDEFDFDLRHDSAGILSMANSGDDTNGSQFFITLADTSHLDFVHSVFGRVVENMDVVTAISNVPTTNDNPDTDVIITKVTITRNGEAAENFDPTQFGLPVPLQADSQLIYNEDEDNFYLSYDQLRFNSYEFFRTLDLNFWVYLALDFYIDHPPSQDYDLFPFAFARNHQFYRMARVAYTYVPASLIGTEMRMTYGGQTLDFIFNDESSGIYSVDEGSFSDFNSYTWQQNAHRGLLVLTLNNTQQFDVRLHFITETNGIVSGVFIWDNQGFLVSETFLLNLP